MARILLADDDADMCEICTRLFARRGHQLSLATNAEDAVSTAIECQPEIILMDMTMPVCTGGIVDIQAGLIATRRIQEIENLRHVPIVALTGQNMLKEKESILAAGCCEVFPKPVQLKELDALVLRHVPPASPA
ncbi:MAG: response regulator [Verrucomicrobiaceae bacterium]|nr:response regulator [Verrucomicrobiaceae bacterium]